MADEVLLEVEDGIATVTLNRPEQLNAINLAIGLRWLQVFDELDRRNDVRVVILTGAGRAFCAGADLAEGAAGLANSYGDRDEGGRVSLRMFQSRKPIIVAFNDAAVGAGMSIPLAADIRIASQEARFGMVCGHQRALRGRLASWLLLLDTYTEGGGIPMTHERIAVATGASRQSASVEARSPAEARSGRPASLDRSRAGTGRQRDGGG